MFNHNSILIKVKIFYYLNESVTKSLEYHIIILYTCFLIYERKFFRILFVRNVFANICKRIKQLIVITATTKLKNAWCKTTCFLTNSRGKLITIMLRQGLSLNILYLLIYKTSKKRNILTPWSMCSHQTVCTQHLFKISLEILPFEAPPGWIIKV